MGKSCQSSSGPAGRKRIRLALKTLGAHRLVPVRKREAPYSSPRGPRCGLACGKARLGAPGRAGEKGGLFDQPGVLRLVRPALAVRPWVDP